MTLTVHHLEQSRSHRVLWLLEELGVPYILKVHQRDPRTKLAPAALKRVHPLGKSPVIVDDDVVVAESGAIIEYLVESHAVSLSPELSHLEPKRGTPEHRQCRFWMHYAEGSLMNWLLMKLVFDTIPRRPMPFFVRPIARGLCAQVQNKLVMPNVLAAQSFIEKHLQQHYWFAGEHLTMADFQMSFAIEALMASGGTEQALPYLASYRQRMQARPAYQRALQKGGPVLLAN